MHPYLNKNINVQIISFVIPLYMNNQKEIDGYNRNARVGKAQIDTQLVVSPSAKATWNPSAGNSPPGGSETKGGRHRDKKTTSPMAKERRWKRSSTKKNMNVTLNGN
jgi:hypothetical protein